MKAPPRLAWERAVRQEKSWIVIVHPGAALVPPSRAGTAISKHLGLQQKPWVSVILGSHGNACKPSQLQQIASVIAVFTGGLCPRTAHTCNEWLPF